MICKMCLTVRCYVSVVLLATTLSRTQHMYTWATLVATLVGEPYTSRVNCIIVLLQITIGGQLWWVCALSDNPPLNASNSVVFCLTHR